MPEPLVVGLCVGPDAPAAAVARSIARSLLPAEDSTEPPPWLMPGQHRSFRRIVAALQRYGGAMLADPVGSGKTYVALAAAVALTKRSQTACLVPATLRAQWEWAAKRLGAELEIVTHEQVSRGRLPGSRRRGVVIIDESHHYRNPATRRYQLAAPWLAGQTVLLVTATPIVNHLADLSHQLRLGIRDDALIADGVASLHRAIVEGREITALAQIVVEEPCAGWGRPIRHESRSPACSEERLLVSATLERLRRLTLSRAPATATLVRGVFLRAAGSSAPAVLGALRRYRTLLLHARDARSAGLPLSRADIRRFAGEVEEQLVMWELVGGGENGETLDLALDDLDLLGNVIEETASVVAGRDPKLERLRLILDDHRPSIVFTARRETVRHLRERLAKPPVAWCTGDRAGVGAVPVPREIVLSWFRTFVPPDRERGPPLPFHLIATDVAAEGLDLQRASRIVHYDAPWTPMRLEQREGRAVRLGSEHLAVDVVRFLPPPELESEIHLEATLSRKASLPARAGLGPHAARFWRWRTDLAARLTGDSAISGIAIVRGIACGVLAGFTLHGDLDGRPMRLGAVAGFLGRDGEWSEDPGIVTQLVTEAASAIEWAAADGECRRRVLRALASPIRTHLALAGGRRWAGTEPDAAARRLAARLRQTAQDAARARDLRALERLERALAFVRGGHSAGESMLVHRLAESPAHELARMVPRLPSATPRPEAIEARLSGVVIFEE